MFKNKFKSVLTDNIKGCFIYARRAEGLLSRRALAIFKCRWGDLIDDQMIVIRNKPMGVFKNEPVKDDKPVRVF